MYVINPTEMPACSHYTCMPALCVVGSFIQVPLQLNAMIPERVPEIEFIDDCDIPPLLSDNKSNIPPPSTNNNPAFVWNGWRYPAGLFRKERRAIMFEGRKGQESQNDFIADRVWVGSDIPNGPIPGTEPIPIKADLQSTS